MSAPSIRRVLLAKEVARRWLERQSAAEYRLRIFGSTVRNLPGLLRSFRNGTRIAGVLPIPDLGVKEGFDSVEVWSRNYEAIKTLQDWAESRGMETSGVW